MAAPLAALVAAGAAAGLSSCSTLTPQVFSDRLVPSRAHAADGSLVTVEEQPTGDVPIDEAISEAQRVQGKYLQAVKDLSEVGTGSNAALIALAAAGLATGLRPHNGYALPGIGLAAGTVYAYNTTMTSQPRQQLFLTGAETLSCAVAATRPYALPAGWLRAAPTVAAGSLTDTSLEGLVTKSEEQIRGLGLSIEQLESKNFRISEPVLVGKPAAAACAKQVLPACTLGSPTATSIDELKQARADCQQRRAALQARCAGPTRQMRSSVPSSEVQTMIDRLQQQRRVLASLATTAREQVVQFGAAGNALWQVTVDTQVKVAREVLKTEPDSATVLAAAKGIKSTAFGFTGAAQLQATAASAVSTGEGQAGGATKQGKAVAEPEVRDAPQQEMQAARFQLDRAQELADQLQSRLAALSQRLKLSRVPLERCGQGLANAALTLVPDVMELTLAPGESSSFTATAASGMAQGSVLPQADAPGGGLTRSLDGAFVYRVPDTAVDGNVVILHFSDAGGRLGRDVSVRVAKQAVNSPAGIAPATMDITSLDQSKLAAALGLPTSPVNSQQVKALVETCLKTKFGVTGPVLEKTDAAMVGKILRGDCRG